MLSINADQLPRSAQDVVGIFDCWENLISLQHTLLSLCTDG
jgi:hypothetical protein